METEQYTLVYGIFEIYRELFPELLLRVKLIQIPLIDQIIQIELCLLLIIGVVVHSAEYIPTDIILNVDSHKPEAAVIHMIQSFFSENMLFFFLLHKTFFISYNMPIGIDTVPTIHDPAKIGIPPERKDNPY